MVRIASPPWLMFSVSSPPRSYWPADRRPEFQHDARTRAAVVLLGNRCGASAGTMCCTARTFIDVAGDAQRRQFANFVGVRDGAAEHDDRRLNPSIARSGRTSATPCACGRRHRAPGDRPVPSACESATAARSRSRPSSGDAPGRLQRALNRSRTKAVSSAMTMDLASTAVTEGTSAPDGAAEVHLSAGCAMAGRRDLDICS